MSVKQTLLETLTHRPLIIDGAMGTQLQERTDKIPESAWEGLEGCNELLNVTCPEVMSDIFHAYLTA
ncbi:homocysteine S-methyltransferase family protein, partial [Sulfuricurvum sp.]